MIEVPNPSAAPNSDNILSSYFSLVFDKAVAPIKPTTTTSNVVAGQNTEAEVRTSVFANIAFATGNSGSTTTGISSATADLNTVATTNTLALRIMGIQNDPDNSDFTAAGIPLIVRINNHFNAPTGSIAAATVSTTGV